MSGDRLTAYGFKFGAADVTRIASMPDGSVCIRIETTVGKRVDVYVSRAGRSLRVFGPGVGEWRPGAS